MTHDTWIIGMYFLKIIRKLTPCFYSGAVKIVKSDGTINWDENTEDGPDPSRPQSEIGRMKLRDILLDALMMRPDSIQWGKELDYVEASEEPDKYDLHFTTGVESGFDMVVGADGAVCNLSAKAYSLPPSWQTSP